MPLVGNLRDFALHDFLYLVDRGYKTGSLLLKRPNDGAALYFDKGKLISVTRPHRHERLGELLVRIGKITRSQCEFAIRAQQNGNIRPLGQILIEQGIISQIELQACIQQQIEETVYDLFAWHEGEFKFESGVRPAIDEVQALTPIPVENLIMEGVRRVDEMSRIKERIPNSDMLVVFTDRPTKATNINMTAEEWKVFARINGKNSISDIAQKTGIGTFDVNHIVFGFITAGLAEVRRPLPPAPSSPVAAVSGQFAPAAGVVPSARTAPPPIKKGLVIRLIERIRGI